MSIWHELATKLPLTSKTKNSVYASPVIQKIMKNKCRLAGLPYVVLARGHNQTQKEEFVLAHIYGMTPMEALTELKTHLTNRSDTC
jgi:hypothetical protein